MTEQPAKVPDTNQSQDVDQQIDVDFGAALERIDNWLDGGMRLLPNIIVAVVVLASFYGLAVLARRLIVRSSARPDRDNLWPMLSVSSVAIGFAFKDILQNWLAGLLILLRQPFEIDDQIEFSGYEGTVERIEARSKS